MWDLVSLTYYYYGPYSFCSLLYDSLLFHSKVIWCVGNPLHATALLTSPCSPLSELGRGSKLLGRLARKTNSSGLLADWPKLGVLEFALRVSVGFPQQAQSHKEGTQDSLLKCVHSQHQQLY